VNDIFVITVVSLGYKVWV